MARTTYSGQQLVRQPNRKRHVVVFETAIHCWRRGAPPHMLPVARTVLFLFLRLRRCASGLVSRCLGVD